MKSFLQRRVLDLPQIFYVTQRLKTIRKRRVEITNRHPALRWGFHHLTSLSTANIHPSFSDELLGSGRICYLLSITGRKCKGSYSELSRLQIHFYNFYSIISGRIRK